MFDRVYLAGAGAWAYTFVLHEFVLVTCAAAAGVLIVVAIVVASSSSFASHR